jgi:hypothetical protein
MPSIRNMLRDRRFLTHFAAAQWDAIIRTASALVVHPLSQYYKKVLMGAEIKLLWNYDKERRKKEKIQA